MPNSNLLSTLLTVAEVYFYLGWSVIPLHGDCDPSRPKVPVIPWADFQKRRISLLEHNQWPEFGGIGIVTGHISHLVVLDFDSHNVMQDFKTQFPDLLETRTVLSANRQLPHLYFHLPPHLHIASQKGQGIDLLAEGRYVVAPPTAINGLAYKIIRGGLPQTLTERHIRRLERWIEDLTADSSHTPVKTSKNDFRTVIASPEPKQLVPHDLIQLYRHHCQQGGRNDALFKTTLYARDNGWTEEAVHNVMAVHHINQPSNASQHTESIQQRQREARATIRSAFSRPARLHREARPQGVLSNSVREKLMQQKRTYIVRTYEGLLLAGIQPHQECAMKTAIELLNGLVGRDSVIAALKAEEGGQRLFAPVIPLYAVATDQTLIESKECSFEERKNQEKVQMGRPQHRFRMPTNAELCAVLGVKETGSDILTQEDLASARRTRMALHRELIKRRPSVYPRRWLARRLGVDPHTIDAYNQRIPIHSRPMHLETAITWKTIERLPFDEPIQGAILITRQGKKYPALRTVASGLLAAGQGITLKQRTANFYWYGDQEPLLTRFRIQQEPEVQQEKVETFLSQQTQAHNVMGESISVAPKPANPKQELPKNLHRPLKDVTHEAQAQHLYQILNQTCAKQLSLANARRLVATYDVEAVNKALGLLSQRQAITNPVGFFIIALRSSSKPF